ncbi:MAG TPA: acetyl ornithine aminotransferase family protein [Vicinamibacterales bacterium]|jgi:4-aminobutyrate aminotransferase|nr:acetyl ornithine aminotransferase family protein [Vicinamibacterales bacterium]
MTGPDLKTSLPGPNAQAIIARDKQVVSTSYTRDYPLVIARGEGAWVEDVDGNVFLDCTAGIAVTSTGHAHPDIVKAIAEQAGKFLHMSGTDFYYEVQVRLAEALSEIAPMPGPHRSFFGNSGTEANEAALKLAKYYTKRHGIIAFFGSFHGRTMGSLSLTASKLTQRRGFGPFVPGTYHAPYPNPYRAATGVSADAVAAESIRFIEHQLFRHLVGPDEIAAIVVEPIQGEGGYVVAPDAFLQQLRDITTKHGMLLIVDEVQSGMGRTGRMFAIEHAGVEPDVVTIAKGIASGLPLGVATARQEMISWPPGTHASTFGGNPVACAAALETIRLLRQQLMKNAADVGAHLITGAKALMHRYALIGDVRGRGLMVGIELVRDRKTKEQAPAERDRVVRECFKRGLLVLGAGTNTIRLSPPLVLSREQADIALSILDESIAAVAPP